MLRECGLCPNEDQTASEVDEITASAVREATQQEQPSEGKPNAGKMTGERGVGRQDEVVTTRAPHATLLFDVNLVAQLQGPSSTCGKREQRPGAYV